TEIVGRQTELLGQPQERAGNAGADRHLGFVEHLAAATQLARQAAKYVVAKAPVVHRLLRVDGRQAGVVHRYYRLGVPAAVEGAQTEHVSGTVKIGDTVTTEAGGHDRLEHAVVDDVEAAGVSVRFVKRLTRFERACR